MRGIRTRFGRLMKGRGPFKVVIADLLGVRGAAQVVDRGGSTIDNGLTEGVRLRSRLMSL
jgi:hypothetical protein